MGRDATKRLGYGGEQTAGGKGGKTGVQIGGTTQKLYGGSMGPKEWGGGVNREARTRVEDRKGGDGKGHKHRASQNARS